MRNLRPIRSLPLLIVTAAAATATAATAHAFTPPIGTDKGSLTTTAAPPRELHHVRPQLQPDRPPVIQASTLSPEA